MFLDELTQNLDPVGRRHTWDVIRRVRDAGTTVVLVTHDVEEAERLCDRIVVLDAGRVVADGTPAAIIAEPRRRARRCGSPTPTSTSDPSATSLARSASSRHGIEVVVEGTGPLLAHVGAHLVAAGRPADDLRADRSTLEERFVALTTPEDPPMTAITLSTAPPAHEDRMPPPSGSLPWTSG